MVHQTINGEAHEDEHEGRAKTSIFPVSSEVHPKYDLPPSEPAEPFEGVVDTGLPQRRRGPIVADISREEIDAKLQAAEARTEARFAQLSGTLEVRFANLDNKIDKLVDSVSQLSKNVDTVRADNKATRWTIVGVVVASLIAGLAAIWTTQGNMLAAFQASLAVKTLPAEPPKK